MATNTDSEKKGKKSNGASGFPELIGAIGSLAAALYSGKLIWLLWKAGRFGEKGIFCGVLGVVAVGLFIGVSDRTYFENFIQRFSAVISIPGGLIGAVCAVYGAYTIADFLLNETLAKITAVILLIGVIYFAVNLIPEIIHNSIDEKVRIKHRLAKLKRQRKMLDNEKKRRDNMTPEEKAELEQKIAQAKAKKEQEKEEKERQKAAEREEQIKLIGQGRKYAQTPGEREKAIEILKKLAKSENVSAQEWLGRLYWNGWYVGEVEIDASKWMKKAWKNGSSSAALAVGYMNCKPDSYKEFFSRDTSLKDTGTEAWIYVHVRGNKEEQEAYNTYRFLFFNEEVEKIDNPSQEYTCISFCNDIRNAAKMISPNTRRYFSYSNIHKLNDFVEKMSFEYYTAEETSKLKDAAKGLVDLPETCPYGWAPEDSYDHPDIIFAGRVIGGCERIAETIFKVQRRKLKEGDGKPSLTEIFDDIEEKTSIN